MALKKPARGRHLLIKNSSYYFRLAIPSDLQPYYTNKEVKYSLRTDDLDRAYIAAASLKKDFNDLFSKQRSELETQAVTKNYSIKVFVNDAFEFDHHETKPLSLAGSYNSLAKEILEGFEKHEGINIYGNSEGRSGLSGPYFLGNLIERYKNTNENDHQWNTKSKGSVSAILSLLLRILGNIPLSTIDRQTATSYKSQLVKLPAHINTKHYYIGKEIEKIIEFREQNGIEPLYPKTVNNHLDVVSSMFRWAIREGIGNVKENHFIGLGVSLKGNSRKKSKSRDKPFTPAELSSLFNGSIYSDPDESDKHYEWKRWLPLLGLYTSARLNELCTLTRGHFKEEHGIYYIDLLDGKTENAERIIPIHDDLIELNFMDFVKSTKSGCKFPLSCLSANTNPSVNNFFRLYRLPNNVL